MGVLAASFLQLVSASVAQNSTKEPVSITLSTQHSQFVVGQQIEIDIILENTSDKEISVAQSNARGNVLDGSGRRAPYLRWGKYFTAQIQEMEA